MHIASIVPFLCAVIVLGVVFYYANASAIIQPWKSILLVILVGIAAIVLLRFVGVFIPLS